MSLPLDRLSQRLPSRFPVGATYVVEGSGGEDGNLRVTSRYVVLPGGRRVGISAVFDRPVSARSTARRDDPLSLRTGVRRQSRRGRKKFSKGRGTKRRQES